MFLNSDILTSEADSSKFLNLYIYKFAVKKKITSGAYYKYEGFS